MKTQTIDLGTLKAVVLYLLQKTSILDFHKLFKIIYFAEMEHLNRYGMPMLEDCFIAMKDGPVPSVLYDIFKDVRSDTITEISKDFKGYIAVENHYFVKGLTSPDMDELSLSMIKCLDKSFSENINLPKDVIQRKSHGPAWEKARNANPNTKNAHISFIDIALEGGANEPLAEYIQEHLNIKSFYCTHGCKI